MYTPIDLSIDFVSATSNFSAQTGDALSWSIFICVSLLCVIGATVFFLRKHAVFDNSKSIISIKAKQGNHAKAMRSVRNLASTKYLIVLGAILLALTVVAVSGRVAFAEPNAQPLMPDTNKISATVADDGTVTFSSCNLKNTSGDKFVLDTLTVTISDEAKAISAINSPKLNIDGFGGTLYSSIPDGKPFNVTNTVALANDESTELNFNVDGIDKETALSLCGKTVYHISLEPIKAYNVIYAPGEAPASQQTGDVPIDNIGYKTGEFAEVKDVGTLAFPGYNFAGWKDSVGTTYQAGDEIEIADEDVALTAQWTAGIYEVKLNPGEDVQKLGTQKIYEKYNDAWYIDEQCTTKITEQAPIDKPEKEGWEFCGYSQSGTAVINANGFAVADPVIFTDNSNTLEAQWNELLDVTGVAVFGQNKVAPNASVTFTYTNVEGKEVVVVTHTNEHGVFVLENIPKDATGIIYIVSQGGSLSATIDNVTISSDTIEQPIDVKDEVSGNVGFTGSAQDANGDPMPNAKIYLVDEHGIRYPEGENSYVVTGPDGTYSFPSIPPGTIAKMHVVSADDKTEGVNENFTSPQEQGEVAPIIANTPVVVDIEGVALDKDGNPCPKGTIIRFVTKDDKTGKEIVYDGEVIDEQGHFKIADVPGGLTGKIVFSYIGTDEKIYTGSINDYKSSRLAEPSEIKSDTDPVESLIEVTLYAEVPATNATDKASFHVGSPTGEVVTSVNVSPGSIVVTETVTIDSVDYERISFVGSNPNWYYLKIDTGYGFNSWSIPDPAIITQETTITAKINPKVYQITLKTEKEPAPKNRNSNDATTTIYEKYNKGWYLDADCTQEISSTNPIEPPTKTGYTFNGYYDEIANKNLNNEEKQVIDSFGQILVSNNYFSIDTTIYAHWTAITNITVTFNKNATDATDPSPASKTVTYDAAYGDLATTTRTGYELAGWYTAASGGDKVETTTTVKNAEAHTLYAHWTANSYSITYKDQGGSEFSGAHETGYPTTHTYGTATTLKGASKDGNIFGGWHTQSDCTDVAITTLGATAYTSNITLYAKWEELSWEPMQAKANAETDPIIDFYPAFNQNDKTVAAYKFAVKNDDVYTEITPSSGKLTMRDIYNALQPGEGTKTKTLYYKKTNSTAQALKCYTVKDLSWNFVFGKETGTGEAKEYSPDFVKEYQRYGDEDNGIRTALLAKDGFGSYWNVHEEVSYTKPLLANSVPYNNAGFYWAYGGSNGGLLSKNSDCAWGCYANSSAKAFDWRTDRGYWYFRDRGAEKGVVLARAFNYF